MPNVVHPRVELPVSVGQAHELVRIDTRLAIAHFLRDHPGSQVREIADAIGGERNTLRNHLTALADLGAVAITVDDDGEPGERKTHRYSVNVERYRELMAELSEYLPH